MQWLGRRTPDLQSESKKSQILHAYYTFLSTLDRRQHHMLKMSTIDRNAGWSHLIWHNFVTFGDNWIQICSLAQIGPYNRRIKFSLKMPNRLGKMSENMTGDFFYLHCRDCEFDSRVASSDSSQVHAYMYLCMLVSQLVHLVGAS